MIILLFYRNNFPAQQQLFCKSRSFELLPFCRPDPGARSESQAVGEHLLHEVVLQTYSWYGFIKILFISHISCLSSKPFPFLLLCVCVKSGKNFGNECLANLLCISESQHNMAVIAIPVWASLGNCYSCKIQKYISKTMWEFCTVSNF